MERQKGLSATIAIVVIILFHVVGLIGFCMPKFHYLFIYMVPYHLLLMLMALFFSYGRTSVRLTGFFLLVYVLGYGCEWLGVHKNWLFGNYSYGGTLGKKVSEVPLLIGVNWFLLVFSMGSALHKTRIRNRALRVLTGAAGLVLLDLLIEPIAVRFNYWTWTNDIIPLKNYICWFLLSVIMLWLFEIFRFKRLSYAGAALIAAQFVFFMVLNLV